MTKITIDSTLCIGCGACTVNGAFVIDEKTGKAKLNANKKVSDKEMKEAAENCPVSAIKIK
jgi:ferredoxin